MTSASAPTSLIVSPLTEDCLFGYDRFGQLMLGRHDEGGSIFTFAADVRHKTCALCGHGWQPTGPSIGDQARWSLIDDYVHQSCLARHCGFVERQDVLDAICGARIRVEKIVPVANGYYGEKDSWGKHMPWYHADMTEHPYRLRIGHRKRVWEIVLTATGDSPLPFYVEARAEFEPEHARGITQDIDGRQILLHAYGTAKMAEYVGRLAKVGSLGVSPTS